MVVGLAFWQLVVIGQWYRVAGGVVEQTKSALAEISSAGQVLAAYDFEQSEQKFAEGQRLLEEAQAQLSSALSESESIVNLADVAGVMKSGDALLGSSAKLAAAGKHLSRGVDHLSGSLEESVEALTQAGQDLSLAATSLAEAEEELGRVNKLVLPTEIKTKVEALETLLPKVRGPLDQYLMHEEVVLNLLGADHNRQYLLVFQNNHEIRPTGGFIGSLGLVNVDRGKVENIDVQTVYDPDGQLAEFIAPPEPLTAIVHRWFLRDANWFVDYETSAKKIASFFEKEGGSTVDGVIALTPEVIKDLLKITGPITVPGHEVTVDSENFTAITQDLVTYSYDREENDPKKFLRDFAPLLLEKVFKAEDGKTWEMVNALSHAATSKQLLVYFQDQQAQKVAQAAGWAGKLPVDAKNLVAVNNANIGGHKSDQFVDQEVDYRAQVLESGEVEVVLTVRRTHNGPTEALAAEYPEGENPAYRDNVVWQRVLVPKEAQLIEASGFTAAADVPRPLEESKEDFDDLADIVEPDPDLAEWQRAQSQDSSGAVIGQESGYKYFANWMVTKPGATTVGLYRYRLTAQDKINFLDKVSAHQVLFVKQPGDTRTTARAEISLPSSEQIVHTVPNEGVTRPSSQTAIYRSALDRDRLVGVVYSK